jgi:hypothetical protein
MKKQKLPNEPILKMAIRAKTKGITRVFYLKGQKTNPFLDGQIHSLFRLQPSDFRLQAFCCCV